LGTIANRVLPKDWKETLIQSKKGQQARYL